MSDNITSNNPSLEDVIAEAVRSGLALVHTSLPGVVVSYDSSTQLAMIQPIVRFRRRSTSTGSLETYIPPPIPNVPVVWPVAAGGALTLGMVPGDQGQLMWAERSTDEWRKTGAVDCDPRDTRRHDYGDAVFVPGGRGADDPLPADAYHATATVLYGATDVLLGDSTATDKVALEPDVQGQLDALAAVFNAWIVVPNDGGGVLKAALGVLTAGGWPTITGATKVKAK